MKVEKYLDNNSAPTSMQSRTTTTSYIKPFKVSEKCFGLHEAYEVYDNRRKLSQPVATFPNRKLAERYAEKQNSLLTYKTPREP